MPKTVPAMMKRFCRDWQTRGVDAWNEVGDHWQRDNDASVGWWTLPEHPATASSRRCITPSKA